MVELRRHRPPQRKARSTTTENINSLPRSTPLFLRGIHPDGLDWTVMPSFLLRAFHFFVVLVVGSSDFALFFHPNGLDRTVMPSFLLRGFHFFFCGFACGFI
ncbi:hypothetical protein ACB092_09G043900 [Castanea dentata]